MYLLVLFSCGRNTFYSETLNGNDYLEDLVVGGKLPDVLRY
jgi:hypothetical protein